VSVAGRSAMIVIVFVPLMDKQKSEQQLWFYDFGFGFDVPDDVN
jgi:hypothetical protein